jgi:hypothetical protein
MLIQLRGRVTEGRWDDLVSFLDNAIAFYEEPGGIRVRLLRDVADPGAFIEVIEYETEESYVADQRRVENDPAMIARLEEWRGLLAGPVEVQTLREVTPSEDRPDDAPDAPWASGAAFPGVSGAVEDEEEFGDAVVGE